jgi:hypothetical protein
MTVVLDVHDAHDDSDVRYDWLIGDDLIELYLQCL